MNKINQILLILFISLQISCDAFDYVMCGETGGGNAKKYKIAAKKYPNEYKIEPIPCEYFYLRIRALKDRVDTLKIKELHKLLIDEGPPITGWMSVRVLDKEGKFLFDHSYKGKISFTPSGW